MKIITVCGSLRYKKEIMEITEKLTLLGHCTLSPIFPADPYKNSYTDDERNMLGAMHKERIKISDAILVADIDNYIGDTTMSEIELAKALNKEIIYYTDIINGRRTIGPALKNGDMI